MHKVTVSTFRRLDTAQEAMLRAMMPRTAAACPEPLPLRHAAVTAVLVAAHAGSRLLRPLTYTLQEASNA